MSPGPHISPRSTQPKPHDNADMQKQATPSVVSVGKWWGGSTPQSLAWEGVTHWRPQHHPQEHHGQLHRKINHMWDLVVMQAREQLR